MEEDEEIRSRPSPADSHSLDLMSTPVGKMTEITVGTPVPPLSPPASSSPQNATAAVALHPPQDAVGVGGDSSRDRGGGGWKDYDCWSESATAVLIDAWGKRFLEVGRGFLRQNDRKDVTEIVNSRDHYGKSRKTVLQCKNRIDTLKKTYKQEKERLDAAGGGSSEWMFFAMLDPLIGDEAKFSGEGDGAFQKIPMGFPPSSHSNLYLSEGETSPPQQQSSVESTRRSLREIGARKTEPETETTLSDSSDSLPPPRRRRMKIAGGGGGEMGFGEVGGPLSRFCEAYEKIEIARFEQTAEIEKERLKFIKELELKRVELFLKTQTEIAKLIQREKRNDGEGEGDGEKKSRIPAIYGAVSRRAM